MKRMKLSEVTEPGWYWVQWRDFSAVIREVISDCAGDLVICHGGYRVSDATLSDGNVFGPLPAPDELMRLTTMTMTLQEAWEARCRLYAEGDKRRAESARLRAEGDRLWAEGDVLRAEGAKLWAEVDVLRAESDKLWAEGDKLRAEGDVLRAEGARLRAEGARLRAEGDLLWAHAVLEHCGNVTIMWQAGRCILGTGDVFGDVPDKEDDDE